MNALPLIYGFRELVAGAGFVAGVTVEGCALVKTEEDGRCWVYGVQPGGVAEHGDTQEAAYLRFKAAFREVLADSAGLFPSFEDFKADLVAMGEQVNEPFLVEWQEARAALRGGAQPEGEMADLPRKTGPIHVGVSAVLLQQVNPKDNPADTDRAVAA
jgi:predicted RNase H-like HicB family nuclease